MQDYSDELSQATEGEDLREYLSLFWHWAWLILLVAVLASVVAYYQSSQITPVYQASTTVLVNVAPASVTTDYSTLMLSEQLTTTYSQMMTKTPILEEVVKTLGLNMPAGSLKSMISVQPVTDTQLIQVSVQSTDPGLAANVGNALVKVFADQVQSTQEGRFAQSKQQLETQMADMDKQIQDLTQQSSLTTDPTAKDSIETKITQYRSIYSNLLTSYEQIRLAEAQTSSSVVQVEPATPPTEPISPNVLRNTLLAAVVGVFLAAGAILAREFLDDRLKSPDDIIRSLGLPVLGVIGHYKVEESRLVSEAQPRSPISESFRTLRTNVQYTTVDNPVQSILVTSAEPGEGKTTVAANLATVIAQGGRDVTLIDCDLRRPAAHKKFNLQNRTGLSTLFIQSVEDLLEIRQPTQIPHLFVLTSGELPPNPSELLGSQRMSLIINRLKQTDFLVIDTPPALAVTDATVLAPFATGIILIVKPGATHRQAARQAVEQLRRVGGNVVGVVVNNLDVRRSYYSYRYYKSYDKYNKYYSQHEKQPSKLLPDKS